MAKIPQSAGSKGKKARIMCWDAIDEMLEAGCDGTEIAAFFGIHEMTLYRAVEKEKKCGFVAYRAQKRASGDVLLKHKMFSQAMTGDKTLQIFLSKNRLGYSDNPDKGEGQAIPVPKWGVEPDAV